MTCIKTGCTVYLDCYGEWLYGDAFRTDNGTYYFRLVDRTRNKQMLEDYGSRLHFSVESFDNWFDLDATSAKTPSTLIAKGEVIYHGYEGVPI